MPAAAPSSTAVPEAVTDMAAQLTAPEAGQADPATPGADTGVARVAPDAALNSPNAETAPKVVAVVPSAPTPKPDAPKPDAPVAEAAQPEAPKPETPVVPAATQTAVAPEQARETAPEAELVVAQPQDPEPETTQAEVSVQQDSAPKVVVRSIIEPESPQSPTAEVTTAAPEQAAEQIVRRPTEVAALGSPQIGKPGGSILDRPDAVPTNRPEAGDAPANQSSGPRPLEANAIPFDVAADTPRMAVVLIHDGAGPLGPDAMAGFPLPVAVAVDTSLPDAAEIAEAYHAQGIEVMALINIPADTEGADAAAAVDAALARMPSAIGVLEGVHDGLQGRREVATSVIDVIHQDGYGLVLQDNGLNTLQQDAVRDGVPAATVFRDFDGAGQDGRAMRRFLDQAAFRARQEQAVVMMGRMRAETFSSLQVWGLQDRTGIIQIVPVSNVLLSPAQ